MRVDSNKSVLTWLKKKRLTSVQEIKITQRQIKKKRVKEDHLIFTQPRHLLKVCCVTLKIPCDIPALTQCVFKLLLYHGENT